MQGHEKASRHAETKQPCCFFSLQIAMQRNPETVMPLIQGGKYLYCTVMMFLFGKEGKGDTQNIEMV